MPESARSGPLAGVRVLEFAGRGPTPFGAMMLTDMGASAVRVDRPGSDESGPVTRGRPVLEADLKDPAVVAAVLDVIARADVLIEGFRPGVMERLGLGPDVCLDRNPTLVYGRMTGWGQHGPLAQSAGHDVNYIAAAGALYPIGREGQAPVPPLNLIGDYGGGGMLLAFGVVCAVLEARRSGHGQVVDASMFDGAALLTTALHGSLAAGEWNGVRGTNMLDTGAPFYNVYETADGRHVAVGAIEGQFFRELVTVLGLDKSVTEGRMDRTRWPAMRAEFARAFKRRTLADWCERFGGHDACFAPVLTPVEARTHPHSAARETFVEVDGVGQPAPAPRFSVTPPAAVPSTNLLPTATEILGSWQVLPDSLGVLESAASTVTPSSRS